MFFSCSQPAAALKTKSRPTHSNRKESGGGSGTSKTVGVIDAGIMQTLKVRGIEPFSADVSITDKQLIHLSHAVKQARGQQVDLNTIKHLPDRLANADVVLRSKKQNELIYAFKRPDRLYDKIAVNLQRKFLKDTLQKRCLIKVKTKSRFG